MTRLSLLLALTLGLGGLPAGAETEPVEGEAEAPLPYVVVPVSLNEVEYLAQIDTSGAALVSVNGEDLDVPDYLPGAVRIARADGASMADEGYRAREVIKAACATQGKRVDPGVVPMLSPAGRWVFAGGCK